MRNKVAIISIGTELTSGLILNTNAQWLARRLSNIGYKVQLIITVPDNPEMIKEALKTAIKNTDIIITTGGLGFTDDDITLETISKTLKLKQKLSREAEKLILERYRSKGVKPPENYRKAAMIPEGAEIIPNTVGTAPGVHIKYQDKEIYILPGVPAEMEEMFKTHIEPKLKEKSRKKISVTAKITTKIEVEHIVWEKIKEIVEKHKEAYIKTHAKKPVEITILIQEESRKKAEERIGEIISEIKSKIPISTVKIETTEKQT